MQRVLFTFCLLLGFACTLSAAEIQGLIIDRNCAQDILKKGRQVILKEKRECSLARQYVRDGYGVLTDDNRFFGFDDAGNKRALELLKNSPNKDNLKVIVTGDIDGDTIKVTEMSIL